MAKQYKVIGDRGGHVVVQHHKCTAAIYALPVAEQGRDADHIECSEKRWRHGDVFTPPKGFNTKGMLAKGLIEEAV